MKENKYKVIIVDDEEPARRNLINALTKHNDFETIAQTSDVKEALSTICINKPDLVFLDIKMPEQDGFKLLDELIKLKYNGFDVIFLTAYSEFAIKAIKYGTFDYLLKPIDPEELEKTLNKYRAKKTNGIQNETGYLEKLKDLFPKTNKIHITTKTGFIYLTIEQIVFIKGEGSYSIIHDNDNKTHTVCKNLQSLADEINDKSLIRVHKSYFINELYLSSFDKNKKICILKSNNHPQEIPVSNRLMKNLT
jgi:two-component system LytT family response regulator